MASENNFSDSQLRKNSRMLLSLKLEFDKRTILILAGCGAVLLILLVIIIARCLKKKREQKSRKSYSNASSLKQSTTGDGESQLKTPLVSESTNVSGKSMSDKDKKSKPDYSTKSQISPENYKSPNAF